MTKKPVEIDERQAELLKIQQSLLMLKRQQAAMKSRTELMPFIKFTMPDPAEPNNVEKSLYENERHHDAIAAAVEEVVKGNIPFLIITVPPRHGKQIAHETKVPTPTGYVRHGDLRPGDYVFGPDGVPVRVLAVSPEATQDVEVEFTNGQVIRCHENHEWAVRDRRSGAKRVRTLETRDLEKDVWIGDPGVRGGRARWLLPNEQALQYSAAVQPLHPYTLGVWLGDGTTTKPAITGVDEEVFQAVAACSGFTETSRHLHPATRVTTVYYSGPRPNVRGQLSEHLHRMGLYRNKHIPANYLRSSKEQRLQLLAGLIDTDGHVERHTGRCRFVTGDRRLADDVFTLAAGLGYRPYLTSQHPSMSTSGIQGRKEVWTVGFQPTEAIPTRLARKQILKLSQRRNVAIRSIRRVEPHLGRCIQVDREDGLYLVGERHVVTHNSEIVSRRLPAWYLGKFPAENVVVATYNDDFAMDFGAEVRKIMTTPQYRQVFPDTRLARGGAAKDRLQTTVGGMATFVGVGGSLTGRGAHILIVDDIFKDYEQARSKAFRDRAWDWFTKVAMTRRMGRKLVIITFTRWVNDDIIGRLIDPENEFYNRTLAEKIKVINLPAIADEDDPIGRAPGEALWPGRFDLEFLNEQRSLDPLGFEALYQQRPSLADGDLFRRDTLRFYDPAEIDENDLRIYCSSDHAVDTKQRSDYTCLLRVGVDKQNNIYLLDCWWRKAKTDMVVDAMLEMAKKKPRPLIWWAEKGHISKSIGPFLRKRMADEQNYFNLVEVTPAGDKTQRAQSIVGRAAMGYLHFPKGKPWVEKAINELLAFPNGLHDDFADALSYIGLGLNSQFPVNHTTTDKRPPRFGTLGWVKEQDKLHARRMSLANRGGF